MVGSTVHCSACSHCAKKSLGDTAFCANSVGFRWSLSLLPYFCLLCVPYGGGMWGIFGKPLKRAIRNTRVCMLY